MNNIIKFVQDKEVLLDGIIPLSLIILTVMIIIVITIILVKNEIKGVKKWKNI